MKFPQISIEPEPLFEINGFPVTGTFLLTLLIGIWLFLFFFFSLREKKLIPKKFQNFGEFLLEIFLKYVETIVQDKKRALEIFPLACFLFFFIFVLNLLELIPGLGVFHFLRSPSSDLNFTLGVAVSSMILVHLLAIKNTGILDYFKKYFHFKNPILFFTSILEGISELTRIFSLAVRLFGNLFAGEILLIVTSFLFPYFLPLPFLGLEILVGFVQALIFSSLIVIFYRTAVFIGKD